MKQIYILGSLSTLALLAPAISLAQLTGEGDSAKTAGEIGTFLGSVLGFIDAVLIPLILGIAFLMFVWGVFKYFILGGADSEKQAEGKSLMFYAIAGFVLILAFYGIINVLTNGLGLSGGENNSLQEDIKTGFEIQANGGSSDPQSGRNGN